ncbi:MAG TPA: hypothetical protein VK718_01915 [Ferruginibacter sp.]|jgi:hypothetical protein|nr:hypothetical protein [Ferruginibacter sp.]
MNADKQRHKILVSFTKIYTRMLDLYKKDNRQLTIYNAAPISIDDLIANCSLEMDRKVFETHLAYFQTTGYTENSIDSKTGIIYSQITPKGVEAYTGQYFLEKYKKDKRDKRLYHSQMTTNKWMKWATIAIAISTFAGVVFQFKSCSSETTPVVININSQSQAVSLPTQLDTNHIIPRCNGVVKVSVSRRDSTYDSAVYSK